jgi:hypothetical protein
MSGVKLTWMLFIGFLFLIVALTGKLGSLLGAVIDPANMIDRSGGGTNPTPTNQPVGTILTASQISSYAQSAGFRGQSLQIATAIALAESGGRVAAVNHDSDGSTDRGLWQINSIHSEYNANRLLNDPAYNAQAAYQISSGGSNWYPWTTYVNGAYQRYLNDVQNIGVLV